MPGKHEPDALIEAHFHEHPHAKVVETLPGMGPRLGAEFITATGGDLKAFGTPDRLADFAGWPQSRVIPAASAATSTDRTATTAAY